MIASGLRIGDLPFQANQIDRPASPLFYFGNLKTIQNPLLAVFSSVKCPAALILKAHDTARELSESGQTVIGGFQSPAEKEMLTVLLRGQSPIVICPARGLEGMRIPAGWRPKLEGGQLLLVSGFSGSVKRPTEDTVHARNQLVAQLASEVLIVHAEPGGKISALVDNIRTNRKRVKFL